MSIFTFSNSRSLLQKTTFLVVRLFIVVALILPQISSAQFNAQINYQGKLLGSGNSAAANGNYNVRFKIYNVATGGSPLWTETWCYSTDSGATCTGSGTDSRVALTSGLFSVMLGSTTPFSGIDFNQTLYLGVDIGGSGATPTWDGEMLPRKKMGAVPAAFVAQTLDGLRKEQFLRTDATNATNTASTFVTLSQAGAGDIARFIGASGANVLTVKSGGGVGIGSTTPQNMLGIERTTGNTLVDIKTNDSSTAAINFINNLNTWQAGISTYGVNAGGFNIGDRSTGSSVVRFAIAPTTGNVGIGTSTPSSKLTVAGDGWFGGNLDVSSSTSVIRISDTGNDALTLNTQLGQLQFYTGGASSNRVVSSIVSLSDYNGSHSVSRGALQFNISSTGAVSEAMRISSAGNVGIGTANPGYALDVSGVINATSLYRIGSQKVIELSGSTLTFGSGNAGSITALTSNAGITMTLVGGNTGIGTTSPWGRLAITGSSTDATNAFLVANSNNTPLFSILNNGNVGIGTTSPFALLSVAGNAYIGGNLTATGTVTLGTLTGPLQALNGLVSATSTMSIAYGGTGLSTAPTYGQVLLGQANGTYTLVSTSSLGITGSGSSFSYLFPGNATSTLLSFTGGLISGASTTIGSGTQAGGLTISGGATTTGNAYFAGNVGIGTTSPESLLDVDGIGTFGTENASTAQLVVKGGASGAAMVTLKRTAGAPSQFSWLLAGGGLTFADDTNGFNVTNIFGDNSQNQLFIGQRGKIVSDSRVSLLSGTTFSPSAGSDVAASELRIQGGLGTGAGTPGDVSFYTGTTLGSGSTAQSGSSRMVIKGNTGFVGIGTTSPVSFLAVQGVGSTGQYGALLNLVTTNTTGAALALSGNGTYDGRTWRILSGGSSNLSGLATGKLVFEDTTAGQTRMVIDTSGNVGIGTTSPTAKLTVWGTSGGTIFNAINSVGSTVFSIDNGTGNVSFQSQGGETQIGGGSGARFNVSSLTSSKIATQISGVAGQTADILNVNSVNGASGDFLTVEANGNVGIGTTSPASKLHIEGAGGATITIQRNDSAQGNGTLAFTGNDGVIDGSIAYNNVIAGALTFNTGGATSANTRMTINSSGNVGIGTSTPTGLLNLASTLPYLYLTDTNAATNNKHWFIENNSGTFGLGTTTDALGLTSTRALTITNAGTMTVAGPVYTSGGGAGGVGTNILATANYVQSRGMNLVSNGSGLLNNNYNFSAWTFDPVETHGGMGSFLQSGSVTRFSDEAIPVDVSKTYREVIWAKSGDTGGANYNAANKQYMGIILLDADGNNVQLPHSVKYPGSTDTTLAAPLNPGDTTVTLTDGTGWYNGSTYYNRNFSWWPYTNAKGYTYPNYTYTRNLSSNYSGNGTNPNGTWSEGGISGNTITLRVAWAGPALAAGTPVRNFQDGSTYKYIAASNISVPNTWTKYEGYIGPASGSGLEVNNEFRAGTAFVKLLFLVNYGGTPENYLRVSDIAFTEMSANNLELATASQQGVVSTTTQTFGGNKTFTGLTTLGYASTTQIGSTGNAYFATAGGNVGIGTTSPREKLEVAGNLLLGSNSSIKWEYSSTTLIGLEKNSAGIRLGDPVSYTAAGHTYPTFDFRNWSVSGFNDIDVSDPGAGEGLGWTGTSGGWIIDVSPLDRSNADGNLNLYNASSNNIALWRPSMWVYNSSNYTTATAQSNGGLNFTTTGTGNITFNQGGNVGIGTTTPYERLAVVGTVVADRFVATSTTATSTFAGGIRVTSGGAQISNLTSCDSLDTDASGNLICGTDAGAGTSPWSESAGVIAPSSANSRVVIGTLSGVTNTALSVFATSSGTTGLVVRGAANQTANFATFQDSTGKAVASINNRGGLSIDVSSTDIVKNTNSTGLSTDFDFTGSTLTNITTTAGQNFIDVTEGTIPASGQGQWVATTTVTAAALGAGGFVILREDGGYLVVHGGGSATASVWDGVTGGTMSALSQNVVSTGSVGAGAIALRRPDGRYLLIHGGGANATTIFDPYARTPAVAGPTLGGLCTTGTNAFLRADGLYVIMCGGTTSWGTYNPSTNTYTAGTAVGTAFGAGAHAIIRDNNTFLVFAGGNTNTHYGYNPFAAAAGTMTAGVITANAPVINTGAFSIRRNEGKFLVIGGAINASTIYDPTETSSNSGWGTMTTQTVSAGFGPTQALADGAQAVWRQDGKYLLLLGGSTATNIIDPSKSDSLQFTTGPALASAAGTGATMFMVPDGTYALVRGGGTAVDIYNAGFVVGGQQYGTRLASYESECITSTSLNPYSSLTWTASGEGRVVVQVRVGIGSCTGNYTQLQSNGDKIPYLDGANRVQFRIFLQRALPKFNDQEWGIRRQNITRYRRNKSDPTIYDLVLRNDNMFKRSLYEFGANVNATSSASSSVPVIVNLSNRVDGVGLGYSSVSNPEYNTLANTTNLAAFNPTFASSTQLTVPVATSSIVMKRPDGRFIILSGATTTTNVAQLYNPVDRSITTNGSQPSAAPGPGALAFKRPDGKFFIVIGNNNTTTIIYDPVGDTFSAGPALTANAGRGAFAIPLPNGQILIGLGAGGTATSVYDPIQNTMKSGPVSTVTLGGGTMALPRPDGTYIVFSGTTDACALSTATALFDPATMAFRTNAGVSVTTGLGPGAYAFQRTDGLWVIVHGGGTATTCTATNRTAIYNPVTNFLVAGPTFGTIPSLGSRVDGNFAIPTADGNWALIQAGATTTAARVWLYLEKYGAFTSNIQSQIGVMVSSYTVNAVNGPNATISGTGPGAIAFQQDDGRFFTLAGGHAPNLLPLTAASSTDRTYMIDAGWVSSGLYKSEAMFVPDLDANSVINWKSTSYKGLSVEVRTATSMDGLQTATARQIETSGGLINPGVGEKWVQFNFNFSRTFPSYRGIYTDVWYNGATPVHTQRTIDSPVLSEVTITKDTDFLNLKMDGLSVFRISSNGNVFLTDGATVNTSGADLAERYSSRQQLKPGEVVSIDPINNHAVQRTTHQYQNDVIGIVSTDPGFVAGAYTEDSYPIALVGRVPVKVSTENGMIKAGDRLTPSSVPGHAMKASLAGRVVGKALESLDASKLEACPSSDIIIPGRKCGTVMVFMNLIDYSGETIDDAILNWETVQKELLRQQDIQTVQVSVLDGGIEAEFESDPLSDITIGISTSSMMSTTTRSARVLSFLEDLKKERESVAASRSEVFVDRVSAVNEVIAPSFLAKALRAETVDGAQIISARIEAGDIETARLLVRGKNSDIVFGEDGQVFLMRKATSSNATTTAGVSTSTALLLTEALALPPGTLISFTDDGGAFFAGELVARGLKTESLTVEGLTTLSGGLLVSSIGTKEGELKVMADTFFAGRAYFNSDSAGDALIPRGGKEVAIKFVKPFAEKPVVNANFSFNESTTTPEQEDEIFRQDIRFVITRRSPEGFRITLNKPAPLDVLFSWTAVGVKDKTTFNGVGAQGLTIFEPQKMHPTTSLPIILTTPQEQLVLISTSTVPVSTTTPASESPSQDSTVSSTEQVQNAPTQIDQGGVILQADPTPAPAPVEVSTPESVATPAVESVPAE